MNSADDELLVGERPGRRRRRVIAAAVVGASELATPPAAAARSVGHRLTPRRAVAVAPYWSAYPFHAHKLMRTISKSALGAADVTETLLAARAAGRTPRASAITAQFSTLGRRLAHHASELDAVDPRGAAAARLRASEYLRAAEFYVPADTQLPAKLALFSELQATFRRATADAATAVTPIEIPYGAASLLGYRVDPPGAEPGQRRPAVIVYGGLDSVAEEVYLWIGQALALRGIGVLIVDGPGQGATLRLRGLPSRPDYEVVTGHVIDYLEHQPWVDARRIGVVGISLGGYYAARSALDRRVRATAAWTGIWDLLGTIRTQHDPAALAFFARQGPWVMGAATPLGSLVKLAQFTMAEVASQIRSPVLITHGEADDLVPVAHAERLHDALTGPSRLHIYPKGTPGSSHCQVDSLPAAWEVVIPWLLEQLAA